MSAVLRETGLTPEERTLRARLAAHVMHSKNDSKQVSQAARDAFVERFYSQVDPDGLLPAHERDRRARHALKAHMTKLAMKSAKARRQG
jgi:hypothetical protein